MKKAKSLCTFVQVAIANTHRLDRISKRIHKRQDNAVLLIGNDAPLGPEWLDHPLEGDWADHRECQIGGDFLLICRLEGIAIYIIRAGALIAILCCAALPLTDAALAQATDKSSADTTESTPNNRHVEFTAEWDDALKARDVQRVTALMRRASGEMPRNKYGETPLHKLPGLHEMADALPVMTALLAQGADVHAITTGGFTPLHMAAFSTCVPCVQVLLRAGARVQTASRKDGTTPLHMSRPETRAALLAAGADIAARDRLGRVPLHTVTLPSAELLGPGVGIDLVDAQGFTPLHWAAFEGEQAAAAWLLSHGANPTLRSTAAYGYTDPILAAQWATTVTYPAGLRPYDLATARHEQVKWSSGKFRAVWELLDKATPRHGLFSR